MNRDTQIREILARAERLPSPPQIALEILDLAGREDVELDGLADLVSRDPALAARFLKVANSPIFRGEREITTLPQCLMVLGLRTVRFMALSFSLVQRSEDEGGFDYDGFWRSAITTAVSGKVLAGRFAPRLADEAFVTGLLLDLGVLALSNAWPERHVEVQQETRGVPDASERERQALGVDHMEVGRILLQDWGLPAIIHETVGAHHRPTGLPEHAPEPVKRLTRLLEVAAAFARLFLSEPSQRMADGLGQEVEIIRERLGESFDCREEADITGLLDEIRAALPEAWSIFDLPGLSDGQLHEVREAASRLLVDLCLETTTDLLVSQRRAQLAEQRTKTLESYNRELYQVATLDGLTGLASRGELDRRLQVDFEAARRQHRPLGLLLLDLDHFKRVNDTYGHGVGDRVLREVGAGLVQAAGNEGFIGRYGGEEFCVVLPNAEYDDVFRCAEAMRAVVEALVIPLRGGGSLRLTLSAGGAWADSAARVESLEELLGRADRSLYEAKKSGRNRALVAALRAAPTPEA